MDNEAKRATVLWFDRFKGIGWACPDDMSADVFLHRKQLPKHHRYVNPGDRIEYQDGEFDGHPCATAIQIIYAASKPVRAGGAL